MPENWTIGRLALKIERLTLPIGLTIDEATIDGEDAGLKTEPFSLSLERPAQAVVRISEESVAKYLETLRPGGLEDFAVTAADGRLTVSATVRVIVAIRAVAVCTLRLRDGKRLDVVLQDVEPAAGRGIVEKQLEAANPILDLTELPVDLNVESVEIDRGSVTLYGSAVSQAT